MPTLQEIRAQFPALGRDTIYLDNAGGSQLPAGVIDAARDFMSAGYVAGGAEYPASKRCSDTSRRAHELVKTFVNGGGVDGAAVGKGIGEVILGPSSTGLCYTLANAFADAKAAGAFGDRNEIIVGTCGHEANVGPWTKVARQGFVVREWPVEMDTDGTLRPLMSTLKGLLSSKTLLVSVPQVSNILGEVYDVKAVTELGHAAGAQVMVDGVAYAPHHAPDVAAWGCDWFVYSTYKVFGPHMGALFGRREAFEKLTGPNHYFIPRDAMPAKWEVGGSCPEGCAMINALWSYACFMADAKERGCGPFDYAVFKKGFAAMARLEEGLMRRIMSYLNSVRNIRIIGPTGVDERRVAIASFRHASKSSAEIVQVLNAEGIGVRYGSFYARRMFEKHGIDPIDGVVRISLSHYNSEQEIDQVISALAKIL